MMESAHVLILSPDGKLILQQRDDRPNMEGPGQVTAWGGSCEAGEQPVKTALREVEEELGLRIADTDLTFWKTYRKTKQEHGKDQAVHLFILNRRMDPRTITIHEGQGYRLVAADDSLDKIGLSPLAKKFVPDFFHEHMHNKLAQP